MKLTENQIASLYKFTRKHYVEWYDLQTELVDHLANDIETIWEEQPNLSFQEARAVSFKKFGVFGFMEVVEARQKQLNKKYLILIWNMFKQYFKLPQLLFTIFLFITIYSYLKYFDSSILDYVLLGMGVYLITCRAFQLHKMRKQRFKKTNKKWLLEEYVLNAGMSFLGGNFLCQFILTGDIHNLSDSYLILIALLLTFFILVTYITLYVLPSKIEKLLENEYPEYKLV